MVVGIIGNGNVDLDEIDVTMDDIIAESGRYLFTVATGDINSLGVQYAKKRGVPFNMVRNLNEFLKVSDYILAIVGPGGDIHGIKNFMMRAKMEGKHGKMVVIE